MKRRNPRTGDYDIIIGMAAKINDLPMGFNFKKEYLAAAFDDLKFLVSSHAFFQKLCTLQISKLAGRFHLL
jgi:hypothetical protein